MQANVRFFALGRKSMGWRRAAFEQLVRAAGLLGTSVAEPPTNPHRIFVLRNNDIGDLLVVTPLFDALRRRFPNAEIVAGIGAWNREVLLGNPSVSRILEINAPWHNQYVQPQGLIDALSYIQCSAEVEAVRNLRAEIGIDVLGSGFGSLLMIRAKIPYRLGVRGYAGGHSAAQRAVNYDPIQHVGRQALRFAEILGCTDLPENRPRIFLTKQPPPEETILIVPGAGRPDKAWRTSYFSELVKLLSPSEKVLIMGSQKDRDLVTEIARDNPVRISHSLRETFETICSARLVICSSSMAMHAAAAFGRPAVVLLSEEYVSASQHKAQWGYAETVMLGKERNRPGIFTPTEALETIRDVLRNARQQESEKEIRGSSYRHFTS
jgi:ADP-heptose:LPS heptosyltransferase